MQRHILRGPVRHQRTFGFMLRDVSQRYVKRFEQHAQTLSLTLPQCRTLVILESNQGLSQTRLARLVNAEPMAMVRILDRMEKDGLLERRTDPDDRRARRLFLTRSAQPLLREIWRLADLTRGELFQGVAQRDRCHFVKVLGKLYENVAAMQDLDDAEPTLPARTAPAAVTTPRRAPTRTAAIPQRRRA
jgi:DNA-binding MarR family transcriptional regulator